MRGELIAWRMWNLTGDQLTSVSHATKWDGPVLVAHDVPQQHNNVGIWCYKRRKTCIYGMGRGYDVLGSIALSGGIVEQERGYRAQRATIRSLEVLEPKATDEALDQLGERYQCSVTRSVLKGWNKPGGIAAMHNAFSKIWASQYTTWPTSITWVGEAVEPKNDWIILPGSKEWISVLPSASSPSSQPSIPAKLSAYPLLRQTGSLYMPSAVKTDMSTIGIYGTSIVVD